MKSVLRMIFLLVVVIPTSAWAQTSDDVNEGARLELDTENALWRLSWWGKAGRTYFIQHSENLLEPWQWVPVIESGDDSVKEWGFTTTGDRFFVRLKYTDTPTLDPENDDFDLDGVSNLDELLQGTDPLTAGDHDGNGMFDDWEIRYFGAVGQNTANDPDGDGLTNLQESLLSTNPYNSDTDGDGLNDDEDPNPFGAEIVGYLWLNVVIPDRELLAEGEMEIENVDDTHIRLEWSYSGDGITHFLVERRISAGPWEEQARVSASVYEWEDEDLRANQNYYYRVRAMRASRRGGILSAASNEASYQVPFLKAFFVRNGSLDRGKEEWSFREFETDAPAPAVPKYYLVKTDTWTYDGNGHYHTDYTSYTSETRIDYTYVQTIVPSAHSRFQMGSYEGFSETIWDFDRDNPYLMGHHTTETYEWREQGRGKQNLTNHIEGRSEKNSSDWDEFGVWFSFYSVGDYLLDGTYVPDQGEPVWIGNDFDLSRGSINYSGLSTYEGTDDYYQSSPDSDGWWPDVAWYGGDEWRPYRWPALQNSTPTRRSYYHFEEITAPPDEFYQEFYSLDIREGYSDLSEEYTTEAFMADVINDLPDWPEWNRYYYGWNWWEYNYWFNGLDHDGRLAHRRLSTSEEHFSVGRSQYRFQSNPTVPHTWTWHEIFVPDDDPETTEDESLNRQVSATRTWNVPVGGGESTDYEIDPSQRTEGNGRYYLDASLQVKGLTTSNTWMDEKEKQSSGLTFGPTISGYEASFRLELGAASQSHTFSWQGEGITLWVRYYKDGQWIEQEIHNGETLTREELLEMGNNFTIRVTPTQMTTAFAGITVRAADSQGTSMGSDSINAKFLPSLLVDGNRDGLMSFSDPQIRAADATGANSKFRFWVNDDDDGSGDGEEIFGSNPDSADNEVRSKRDLEDFTRLYLYFGGLQAGIVDGTFKIGLKWKNTGALKPVIKVYQAVEADGGTAYLSSETTAAAQISGDYQTAKATVSGANAAAALLPASAFANYSAENPVAHLLFEGVSEGMGELVVTLHKADGTEIGEGPGVWLDIKNIHQMYERGLSNPLNMIAPFDRESNFDINNASVTTTGGAFQKPTDETSQCIIYVHGWNTNMEDYQRNCATMYKRLWHRGFKGRFAGFRWDTLKTSSLDTESFHFSEWRGYKFGGSLQSYVTNLKGRLPGYSINVIAHSLGSAVLTSALDRGAVINNCIYTQGALTAHVFDPNAPMRINPLNPFPAGNFNTPDLAIDGGYRGWLAPSAVNVINFYNEGDQVLGWWKLSQNGKPHNASGPGQYKYTASTDRRWVEYSSGSLPSRDVFDNHESMAFVAIGRAAAVGAEGATGGAVDYGFNLGDAGLEYGGEHSPQFDRHIQKSLIPYYNQMLLRFDIVPNP